MTKSVVQQAVPAGHQHTESRLRSYSEQLDWQTVLFAPEPERAALLRLHASWPLTPRRIRFHRNHAIEPALTALRPYLEYAGIRPNFLVGDYDDSLSLLFEDGADVEVIWLDYSRFNDRLGPHGVASWLGARVAALRSHTSAPILVLDWDAGTEDSQTFARELGECIQGLHSVHLGDRRELFAAFGGRYFDLARVSLTGTRMSRQGTIGTARLLGSWLTALLEPRLKALVVDLDNTLYDGVIGEDGIDAVELTEAHVDLHRLLLELRDSGLFLGLLSRNDPADVRALFESRTDFPLGWDDFSAHSVGWELKSTGIARIACELRIDPATILFVDDNVGELLETMHRLPRVRCLHATTEADRTVAALRHFPGLWTFTNSEEDGLRVADLHASDARNRALARAGDDLGSYYQALGVRLTVDHDPGERVIRMAELSRKTNQFNLAMRRFDERVLRSLMGLPTWQLSTARLADRLTDSGVIAIAVLERQDRKLLIHDLCISCRALGRRLEDLIVAQLVASGPLFDDAADVVFRFMEGPRNQPARKWLSECAGIEIPHGSHLTEVFVPSYRLRDKSVNPHVTIEVNGLETVTRP